MNRENARQEGQAGNKAAGARAKRQVGRTGKKYLFGRLRRAIDRTKRRADKHRETGKHGAAVHRAKNVEAELWDRKLSAKHENTNAAYPLTADRVHIHEINIVKGKLASGNGTRLKPVGPLTKAAIRKREAGQETPASKKSLEMAKTSATNAAARRPSKFDGPRIRTKLKKPVKPNTEPLPKGFEGGIAGSTEDIQNQIARRGHSR